MLKAMKKFIKILIALLVIVIAVAAVAAGVFYKKATPTLMIDLSREGGKTASVAAETIAYEFTNEQELDKNGGRLTSSFWTSKWCLDMNEKACRSIHFDFTDYDFKSYLKDLKTFNFRGFRGVAAMNDDESGIEIVCKGNGKSGDVIIYGFGKTALAGKTLEIMVEEAVYKGDEGETVLPVILRDYTSGAGDKLKIKLSDTDVNNTYHIKISVADPSAVPAYENKSLPVRYAFDREKKTEINAENDGVYNLSCIFGETDNNSVFELYIDGKSRSSAETFKTTRGACVTKSVKLKKGKHTLQLVSEEPLPEFESVVVSPESDADSIYLIKNPSDGKAQSYTVVAAEEGEYCIASTELYGSVTVNSEEYTPNELGAVNVKFGKGFNELSFSVDRQIDFKITQNKD